MHSGGTLISEGQIVETYNLTAAGRKAALASLPEVSRMAGLLVNQVVSELNEPDGVPQLAARYAAIAQGDLGYLQHVIDSTPGILELYYQMAPGAIQEAARRECPVELNLGETAAQVQASYQTYVESLEGQAAAQERG